MVVADDYGMNSRRTDAILAASAAGSISRTSFLVNGEDAARAGVLGRAAHLPVGLHFNITEGYPVSAPPIPNDQRACPMLTWPNEHSHAGRFLGKRDLFLTLEKCNDRSNPLLRQAAVDTVARELRSQLDLFVNLTGVTDVWVDGHHHVHVLSIVWDAIEMVAGWKTTATSSQLSAPWRIIGIRVPHDPSLMIPLHQNESGVCDDDPEELRFRSEEDIFGFPFWKRVSHLSSLRRSRVPPHICCADLFIGFDIGGSDASAAAVVWKVQESMRCASLANETREFTPPKWRPQRLLDILRARRCYDNDAVIEEAGRTATSLSEVVVELMTHLGYPDDYFSDSTTAVADADYIPLFLDDARPLRMLEWRLYTSPEFTGTMREYLHAQIV